MMNEMALKVVLQNVATVGIFVLLLADVGLVWLKAHPAQLREILPDSHGLSSQAIANTFLVVVTIFLVLTVLCVLG